MDKRGRARHRTGHTPFIPDARWTVLPSVHQGQKKGAGTELHYVPARPYDLWRHGSCRSSLASHEL